MSDIGPIALDRWAERGGGAELQAQFRMVAERANANPSTIEYVTKIFDSPYVSKELLSTLMNTGQSGWTAYIHDNSEPDQAALFPDRDLYQPHIDAINTLVAITGVDYQTLSDGNPGLGYTGAEGIAAWQTANEHLNDGTIFHDITSALMAQYAYAHGGDHPDDDLNGVFFHSSDIVISALLMAGEAYLESIADSLIPPSSDILTFLGGDVKKQQLIATLTPIDDEHDPVAFYQTVSKLGNAAGQLASELTLYFGNQSIASQITTEAFSKTLAGYVGDSITFATLGNSLSAQAVYGRFYSNFLGAASNVGAEALTQALERTLGIDGPIGQFIASSTTTAVTNVALDQLVDRLDIAGQLGVSPDFAKSFIGTPAGTNLGLSFTAISGEILRNVTDSLGSFVSGQLFSYLDAKWTAFNLNNLGSSLGGIIGSFIAPGIGGFIGQVAGGIIFDILDGTPRSFHEVRFDPVTHDFTIQFVFSDDGGQEALSLQLAETAMSSVQLALGIVGGDLHSIQAFTYGHYEDQLTYEGAGSGRVKFDDANVMLARGVLAQLRTADVEGGNAYAKDLLTRAGYNPSLDAFYKDFGVADVYDMQKADPYLFGLQMINVSDEGARRFVLTNWQNTLDAARALGFDNLSFNDGSEFVVRVSGDKQLSGGRGNDFLYAESGTGAIDGGDGDDIVRFDVQILSGSRDAISGGAGVDRYEGDLSALAAGGANATGVRFTQVTANWFVLTGPDNTATADFFDFEHFAIVGTQYNDYADITEKVVEFDGGQGVDTINVNLGASTTDITLDIDFSDAQLEFDQIRVRNVERVGNVVTGSGDDTIRIGTALLVDPVRNNLDANGGFDVFEGDFSSFVKSGTGSLGVTFLENTSSWYILTGPDGIAAADFNDFERFSITATSYDDAADFTDKVLKFDGKAGVDTVNLVLGGAVSNIVFDLAAIGPQLTFGAADLRNVERVRNVVTGSGDDTIRIGTALLVDTVRNNLDVNGGFDVFAGDFSDFVKSGTGSLGVTFLQNNATWYILTGPDGNAAADFNDFERFSITATSYDDAVDFTDRFLKFDGRAGVDTVNLQLETAVSSVVFDLTATGPQLTFGAVDIRNVERVKSVVTGSGDDTIRVGTAILVDTVRNNLDVNGGFDVFEGDFSDFVKSGTGSLGVTFLQNNAIWYILTGPDGIAAADFNDFERFSITATNYDDAVDFTDRFLKFDGKAGVDTVNLQLETAASNIVFDLAATGPQLTFVAADIRNVERVKSVITGSGDDTIRVGTALLVDTVRNNLDANGGFDVFEGDFSSFVKSGTGPLGVTFRENSPSWHILTGSDGNAAADFNDFERFSITATSYDDAVDFTDRFLKFDGKAGVDTVNLQLGTAVSSIVFDLAAIGPQLTFGAADLRNVERVSNVVTGSGDDTIRVGTALLVDTVRNNLDANGGFDVFEGDFSSFVKSGAGTLGVTFRENSPSWHILTGSDGNAAADFNDFERFSITATSYDDRLVGGASNDALRGGGGSDTLSGSGGNDTLDGGAGTDIVSYSGSRSNYSLTQLGGGVVRVTDLRAGSPDGVDDVSNVETFQFSDGVVSFPPVSLAVASTDSTKLEGNAGATAFTFTVTRTGDTSAVTTADWTVTGSGANPADFQGGVLPSGTVSFAAGQTSKVITVNVAGDTTFEANEGFTLTLSNPSGVATLTTTTAAGTIINDDVAPTLAIAATDATKLEGATGTTAFTFTVTRTGDVSAATTANWSVAGSGAAPAAATDFVGGVLPAGTVSFAAGETSKTIMVNVAGDTTVESEESFTLSLSNPSGGQITAGAGSAVGVITNDDAGAVSVGLSTANTLTKAEGSNGGSTAFSFVVNRTGDTAGSTSVDWSVGGSGPDAASASDFTGGALPSGTVTFAAGETSKSVVVGIAADAFSEANEGFTLTLANASGGASLTTASRAALITNDDGTVPTVSITGTQTTAEGSVGSTAYTFTVTRAGLVSGGTTVDWTVAGSGANPASAVDFLGGILPSGSVSFAAGETSKTVTVDVAADTAFELTEAFTISLSNPSGAAVITTPSAVGTITNDDTAPSLAIGSTTTLAEGNGAPTAFTFTVTRTGDISGVTTAHWTVAGSGAVAASASDFVGGALPSGMVTFAAGESTQTIVVQVAGDSAFESKESFTVTLSGASSPAIIKTASATGNITNDDTAPSLSIAAANATVQEGNSGVTDFTFTVTRSGDDSQAVSVAWAVTGAATNGANGADFAGGALPSGIVSFAAGETSRTITVGVAGDTVSEVNEGFVVTLSNPTGGASVKTATATGTILNDEGVVVNGTTGNDNISDTKTPSGQPTTTVGNDTITGIEGNDTLNGAGGADRLVGGAGNDLYVVDNVGDVVVEDLAGAAGGTDTVSTAISFTLGVNFEKLILAGAAAINGTGNELANTLTGNGAANRLDGAGGDDTVTAGDGADTVIGGEGNDKLDGGLGADSMAGGAGDDSYAVDDVADLVSESLGAGTDTVTSTVNFTLGGNIEKLILGAASAIDGYGNELGNTITGNTAANLLSGLGGDDTLSGGLGTDTLQGGEDADKLDGGGGADSMSGGGGNDSYAVDDAGDLISEAAGGGADTVTASVSFTLSAEIEKLTLTGTSAANGTGNDLDNLITGNDFANGLFGLGGADSLTGGLGNDTLNGGAGADQLTGSTGADVFIFARGEAAGDRIKDFASGDQLRLTGYGAGSTITKAGASLTDWVITDGVTHTTETITLTNKYILTAGDFLFGS